MSDEKRLYPFRFLPKRQERPWGVRTLKLADLGETDTMVDNGWFGGNALADLMQTYLERVVGETAFDRYGTQFPVMVDFLEVEGRTSLRVFPDDIAAEQRYDAFGKTAFWYVAEASADAVLWLGFEKEVTAAEFFAACQDGTVERLLHPVRPRKGDAFLLPPGLVHAAAGKLKLVGISEASDLVFRLHDWGRGEENHLEEAFDLIDFRAWSPTLQRRMRPGQVSEKLFATPQFTVSEFHLKDPVRIEAEETDTFLVYVCVSGGAAFQVPSEEGVESFPLKAGEVLMVPAEIPGFSIVPSEADTVLLEAMLEPQEEPDAYINRDAEPYLDGEEYNGLEGEDFTDWAGPQIVN
jgi:mannose-6-phosphate isomerase